jgi:hypothetical protein
MTTLDEAMAPWSGADPDKLARALSIENFRDQVFALLELAPKTSATQLAALPWDGKHYPHEFRALRSEFAAEQQAKREQSKRTDERPIADVAWDQLKAAVRTGDFVTAEKAAKTLEQLAKVSRERADQSEDDFARLTDNETMVLAALVHKLRDEPLTDLDAAVIEYVAEIAVDVRPE